MMKLLLLFFALSLLNSQHYPKSNIYNYYKNCTGTVSYVDNTMNSYEQNGLVLLFNNTDYILVSCSYNDIKEIN
jgi:hypothetical protein